MSALNMQETESLNFAQRAMSDAQRRLSKAAQQGSLDEPVKIDREEVAFMIQSLDKGESLVKTVKTMKGYYPK